MNKLIILLLAVCLASTHALVKRDAPAGTTENYVNTIQSKLNEFTDGLKKNLGEAFDPDNIKQNFNEFVDKMNKAVADLKPKENEKKD